MLTIKQYPCILHSCGSSGIVFFFINMKNDIDLHDRKKCLHVDIKNELNSDVEYARVSIMVSLKKSISAENV